MKKAIRKILQDFDCAYGGDILIGGETKYLHLSYEEVRTLLKGLKKKDQFAYVVQAKRRMIKKVTQSQQGDQAQLILSASDVLGILQEAKRPKEHMNRKVTYKVDLLPKQEPKIKTIPSPRKHQAKKKNQIRFDWHDHYLEGLRIHGNKDDAEAHADEMKRKILNRI